MLNYIEILGVDYFTKLVFFCTSHRSENQESKKELLCNENSFDTKQIFTIDFFSPLAAIIVLLFPGFVRFVFESCSSGFVF